MEIINVLIKQFKSATGVRNIDTNSSQFLLEFNQWLKERNKVIGLYTELLECMDLNFKDSSCVEVGKTSMDSVVIPYDTTIITPYSEGFEKLKNRVLISDLKIYNNIPILVSGKKVLGSIYNESYSTYMTQNPYNNECIKNWEQLHNSGKNKIIVGVFGYKYDKDINKKIEQLKYLKYQLKENYIEDFNTYKDRYCYVVASGEKVKIKVKRKYLIK